MENSPLATESFSYSWLTDKPQHHNLQRQVEDDDDGDDFRFDVSPSPTDLVNAGEIFSEGQIMADGDRRRRSKISTSVPSSPLSGGGRSPRHILWKWRRKILRKWLGFVNRAVCGCSRKSIRVDDLQKKVLELRSSDASPCRSSAVGLMDDLEFGLEFLDRYCPKIDEEWKNFSTNTKSPNRSSSSYVRCDEDENSISEAILYCKKSISM